MLVVIAIICILVGGAINGSFAVPVKSIQQWNFENIWLNFAIWAFLVLPWASLFVLAPHIGLVYQNIPLHLLITLIVGGTLFGMGQVCFVRALNIIGFGLSFTINIGLGASLGFLLPLITLHPEKMLTAFGLATLIGVILTIIGLLISYRAGEQRSISTKQIPTSPSPHPYSLGITLAVLAGFSSAIQNFTFAATSRLEVMAVRAGMNPLAAATIIWPIFLTFTFIAYALYMLYLHQKNHSFIYYQRSQGGLNYFLSMIMGMAWYLSLLLYSQGALLIGSLGPLIGWPLFMVLIILSSNFWGWRYHEWEGATSAVKRQALSAIGLLLLAVMIFAYSALLS